MRAIRGASAGGGAHVPATAAIDGACAMRRITGASSPCRSSSNSRVTAIALSVASSGSIVDAPIYIELSWTSTSLAVVSATQLSRTASPERTKATASVDANQRHRQRQSTRHTVRLEVLTYHGSAHCQSVMLERRRGGEVVAGTLVHACSSRVCQPCRRVQR